MTVTLNIFPGSKAKSDAQVTIVDPAHSGLAREAEAAKLVPERLVNLGKHDYSLEPNGNFSPDGKWLVFRSNMRGPIQVYAVEVAKANN